MPEHYNFILAIVLSIVILLGFQYLYEIPQQQQPEPSTAPGAPEIPEPAIPLPQQRQTLIESQKDSRILIQSPHLQGSLLSSGLPRIDDITLITYQETPDPESPSIVLLSPAQTNDLYYIEFGWRADENSDAHSLPNSTTQWRVVSDHTALTPTQPLSLEWDNGEGLLFQIQIALDEYYLFTITQQIHNTTATPLTFYPYALVRRNLDTLPYNLYILHEGPIGVFNETLSEYSYSTLQEQSVIRHTDNGDGDNGYGWIGITDKYWLVALLPTSPSHNRFVYTRHNNADYYQTDLLGSAIAVLANETASSTIRLFVGAKEVDLLDRYATEYDIVNFDLAVDFGWFYFLTKPFFYILDFFYRLWGNFGVAILVFTVLIKVIFYPLSNYSYIAMNKIKLLHPEILKLRERFENDKTRLSQELMTLYKREKVSPASGCLPILVQIPVFFALYKVLFVTIEMRHAPFYGWIVDLSSPDPTSLFNLFGLIPWQTPTFLMIGVWPILMGVTMFLQQRLNPPPVDPIQAKIFMALPVVFTFILANFPAGLVIYWTWNNLLSIFQQWMISKTSAAKTSSAKS